MVQTTRKHYTDAEVDRIISNDILSRDCKRFVYQRQTGRLGWEKNIEAGKGYSSFLLGKRGIADRELIRTAYGYAKSLLCSLDLKQIPQLSFNTGDGSFTNGRTVHVSTDVLDDTSLEVTRRLDVLLGLTLHEGMHVECTDMGKRVRFINGKARSGLEVSLENIVEDERIERHAGNKYAGLANYLKETKYYMFERNLKKLRKEGKMDGLDDIARLVNAILSIIRYPAALEEEDKHAFGDYLVPIHELLSKEFPKDYDGTLTTASKIYDIIEDMVKKQQEQNQEGGDGDGKSQSDKQDGGGDGSQSGESGESGRGSNGQESEGDGSGDGNGKADDKSGDKADGSKLSGKGKGAGNGKAIKDKDGKPMSAKQVMDLISDAMAKAVEEIAKSKVDANDQSKEVSKLKDNIDGYCEGTVDDGAEGMLVQKKPDTPEATSAYEDSLNRVRRYVPANRNILEATSMARTCISRGLRNGRLDTAKLAEAFQGVPTVYTRCTEEPAKDVNVCVLIDESGSMYGQNEVAARDFAVLMNEALGNLDNVDLSIYGYTSGLLYAYRERGMENRFACGAISSHGGTPTREAILSAHKRVSEGSECDCLMFVVSDGEANQGPSSVRRAVDAVKKEGTTIVGVSIDSDLSESSLREMYDNYVVMTHLDSLAKDLTASIRKAVLGRTTK